MTDCVSLNRRHEMYRKRFFFFFKDIDLKRLCEVKGYGVSWKRSLYSSFGLVRPSCIGRLCSG